MQISPFLTSYQNISRQIASPVKNINHKADKKALSDCDLNFCANYLYGVNLRRRTTKNPIDARVVELDYSNKDDLLMLNLSSLWGSTEYFFHMFRKYYKHPKDDKFFIVAKGGQGDDIKAKDVQSVIQFSVRNDRVDGKTCKIAYLQASPEIADNEKSSIRGAGELAIYSVVKYAKKNGCRKVALLSTNNGFYENIGFEADRASSPLSSYRPFYLDEKDYDWFLKRVEEKYKLN